MMDHSMENNREQTCPQCDNHCPVDALQCGKGRKYFGVTEAGHDHDHGHGCGHRQMGGLSGLLHRCGRFVRHAELEEDELFQALTGEEKATLQALLDKLSGDWQARFGGESMGCCHHGHSDYGEHRHKHGGHDK